MSAEHARRGDWIIGGLALVLVIVLLELPWYTVGGGTVSGIKLPSISEPATGSPAAVFGLFAVIAALAVLLDLVLQHLSPDTRVPAVSDSRTFTRLLLAGVSAFFLALKFIFNISKIGNFGVGCWLGLVLVAALVWVTAQARRQDPGPHPQRQAEDAEAESEGSGGSEGEEESERPGGRDDEGSGEGQEESSAEASGGGSGADEAEREAEAEGSERRPQGA